MGGSSPSRMRRKAIRAGRRSPAPRRARCQPTRGDGPLCGGGRSTVSAERASWDKGTDAAAVESVTAERVRGALRSPSSAEQARAVRRQPTRS